MKKQILKEDFIEIYYNHLEALVCSYFGDNNDEGLIPYTEVYVWEFKEHSESLWYDINSLLFANIEVTEKIIDVLFLTKFTSCFGGRGIQDLTGFYRACGHITTDINNALRG
ncbi:hypothetical protein bcgnr5378_04630 [Bacillus cereus]|uniref:Uncharacterized protein n=1 Tax=Bacillus cereus TaxID=1396 RepID=A0A164LF81_BACCE|nr:hypothetical protein [Bacillus cereus]KZD55752.1 hypothetical protein B4088_5497 [Bacillus cereus]